MNFKKNGKGLICLALALVMIFGSTFAYFTDRASTSASGTAGSVGLDLQSNINLLDEDGQDILNPGDLRDGSFTVTNTGNKSIDVRTTIKLTSSVAMTGDANTQSEYDLYLRSDVEEVEGEGWKPKAGATPLQIKEISPDGKTITYTVPEYILNGNEGFTERETEDGVDSDSKLNDFVLVFAGSQSGNAFQNSTVSLDVLVEAKQHRNTGAGWTVVAQESYSSGAINQNAVPEAISPTIVYFQGYIEGPESLNDIAAATPAVASGFGVEVEGETVTVREIDYMIQVNGSMIAQGMIETSGDTYAQAYSQLQQKVSQMGYTLSSIRTQSGTIVNPSTPMVDSTPLIVIAVSGGDSGGSELPPSAPSGKTTINYNIVYEGAQGTFNTTATTYEEFYNYITEELKLNYISSGATLATVELYNADTNELIQPNSTITATNINVFHTTESSSVEGGEDWEPKPPVGNTPIIPVQGQKETWKQDYSDIFPEIEAAIYAIVGDGYEISELIVTDENGNTITASTELDSLQLTLDVTVIEK